MSHLHLFDFQCHAAVLFCALLRLLFLKLGRKLFCGPSSTQHRGAISAHQSTDYSCTSLSTDTYRLARPSSRSLCCNDWRCIPKTAAARVTLPEVSSRHFVIYSRSNSRLSSRKSAVNGTASLASSTPFDATGPLRPPNSSGRSSTLISTPSAIITARSIVLRSSRTFPGHGNSTSRFKAARDNGLKSMLYLSEASRLNLSASIEISSRRSRNGGTSMVITRSR